VSIPAAACLGGKRWAESPEDHIGGCWVSLSNLEDYCLNTRHAYTFTKYDPDLSSKLAGVILECSRTRFESGGKSQTWRFGRVDGRRWTALVSVLFSSSSSSSSSQVFSFLYFSIFFLQLILMLKAKQTSVWPALLLPMKDA